MPSIKDSNELAADGIFANTSSVKRGSHLGLRLKWSTSSRQFSLMPSLPSSSIQVTKPGQTSKRAWAMRASSRIFKTVSQILTVSAHGWIPNKKYQMKRCWSNFGHCFTTLSRRTRILWLPWLKRWCGGLWLSISSRNTTRSNSSGLELENWWRIRLEQSRKRRAKLATTVRPFRKSRLSQECLQSYSSTH